MEQIREKAGMKQGVNGKQTGIKTAPVSLWAPALIYSGGRPDICERTDTNMRATAQFRFLNCI